MAKLQAAVYDRRYSNAGTFTSLRVSRTVPVGRCRNRKEEESRGLNGFNGWGAKKQFLTYPIR